MPIADYFGNKSVPNKPGSKIYNPYAAGGKRYGSGRAMPTLGPVSQPQGYDERDNRAQARKNAILRRMQGQQSGNPLSSGIINYISKGAFD